MDFAFSSHHTTEKDTMAATGLSVFEELWIAFAGYGNTTSSCSNHATEEDSMVYIGIAECTAALGKTILPSSLLSIRPITGYLDVISPDIRFTVTSSLEGGIDIEVGSATIHVPKYFSVQHPVCQMVLLADGYGDEFYYPKKLAPRRIVQMFEKSHSSASPNVYEAGWVAAKPEFQPHNAHGSEFGCAEICAGSIEPSVAVLIDIYSASEAQRADDGGFILDSGTCERSNTSGERETASTITLHGEPLVDDLGDEKHTKVFQSSYAPLVTSSSETSDVHMVHELGESELEHQSGLAVEPVIVKTEEAKASATWIVATAAPHHATGNRDLLSSFTHHSAKLIVHGADGTPMEVLGCGNVITDAVVLPDVWYIPGLTANLISVSQLTELDYGVGFSREECYIRSPDDGGLVGSARVGEEGLFEVDFLKVPFSI